MNILEKEELYEIIEIYSEQIKGASEERFFRKNFINDLKNADINKDIRKDIVEIVSNLPTSENNIDSFFVKYSGISSEEAIVTGLIANTAASAEHIIPKSRGGKNKLSNYMCDCADCNSTRRSSDFKNWDKEIPNFEENLQEYLDSVAKGVEDGTLNHWYIDYIENVAKTISFATDGKIELKVPSVDKDKICKWQPPQLTD